MKEVRHLELKINELETSYQQANQSDKKSKTEFTTM